MRGPFYPMVRTFPCSAAARIGKAVRPTLLLTLSCFAVTMLIMAVVGVYWLGLSWLVAMTMGAILGGTSSATVVLVSITMTAAMIPAARLGGLRRLYVAMSGRAHDPAASESVTGQATS